MQTEKREWSITKKKYYSCEKLQRWWSTASKIKQTNKKIYIYLYDDKFSSSPSFSFLLLSQVPSKKQPDRPLRFTVALKAPRQNHGVGLIRRCIQMLDVAGCTPRDFSAGYFCEASQFRARYSELWKRPRGAGKNYRYPSVPYFCMLINCRRYFLHAALELIYVTVQSFDWKLPRFGAWLLCTWADVQKQNLK